MASFCAGCINVNVSAIDTPELPQVTSMENMFSDAKAVNFDVSQWKIPLFKLKLNL